MGGWATAEAARRWRSQPHVRVADAQRSREKQAERRLFTDWLKAMPCQDCGGCFPSECMDFDHRAPFMKVRDISKLLTGSAESISTEVQKCDLVCSNCHRTRTRGRR